MKSNLMLDWPKREVVWIEGRVLYASIPFTWCLPRVRQLLFQRSFEWDSAIVGGPAVYLMPDYFKGMEWVTVGHELPGVLQRINPWATRTTTGCVRKCDFCGVPKFDGGFKELEDWPDRPLLCDNNILASSKRHFNKVIDRLKKYPRVDFNQGLDARLLKPFHAARIAELKKPTLRLALDDMAHADLWEKAYRMLRAAGLAKRRFKVLALIAFNSGPREAWQRCQWITSHGVRVSPMWFHTLDGMERNTVTKDQESLGWDDYERKLIMQYYYQRGKHRALILKDYGWRLK